MLNSYKELIKKLKSAEVTKIVLEGIDGAGKTTLANKLKKDLFNDDCIIIHCTRNTPNTYRYFEEIINRENTNIIMDRAMYGQFVYNTHSDRHSNNWMKIEELIDLTVMMDNLDIPTVYVSSDLQKCLENCLEDSNDSYYTMDYIKELDIKYKSLFDSLADIGFFMNYYNDYEKKSEKMVSKTEVVEYENLPEIIAVDFDETLVRGAKFPEIGKINEKLRYELFEGKYKHCRKILWTCRDDEALKNAIIFCQDNNMHFDEYNRNIKEVRELVGRDTRKVYADVYIDDKAEHANEYQ